MIMIIISCKHEELPSLLTSAIWKSTLSTTSPPGLVLASNTLLYSELKWTRCISSGNLGGTSLVSTRKHYEALESNKKH